MAGPLKGVTVLELAGIGPVPFAGMLLADMGADVIRIDRVQPSTPPTSSSPHEALLRNDGIVDRGRRSIALDLKDARGLEAALRLADRADILIEGFRPGVTEKLGLGPEVCMRRHRRLVYGRMTGWGQTGPLAQAAGHDINYIALTGALHAMGSRDRPPAPPLNLVGDYGGGAMFLALGVVAALCEARLSGLGQVVDAAMTDGTALLMAAMYSLAAKGLWSDQRESNFIDGSAPFYGNYECSDGAFVSIGAIEPPFYKRLLDACGVDDPHLESQWDRAEWAALKLKFAALFRTRSRDQWSELLEGSDACFAPVLSMHEAPRHPHNVARATFVESDGVMQPAPAPRFARTPSVLPSRAPAVGQDSVALLRGVGYNDDEIAGLREAGVLSQWVAQS